MSLNIILYIGKYVNHKRFLGNRQPGQFVLLPYSWETEQRRSVAV